MKKMLKLFIILSMVNMLVGCEKHYNEWVLKNDEKYYYNAHGKMLKNTIQTIEGEDYYFDSNGKMTTGVIEDHGKKYFFNEEGKKTKNKWVESSGEKYYYDINGERLSNVIQMIDGYEYCFDSEGKMVTGVVEEKNKKFLFGEDGKKSINEWKLCKNKYYKTNEKGELVIGWFLDENDGSWYYMAEDGHMYKDQWAKIENNKYYFDANGCMVHDKLLEKDGKTYYFDSNGFSKEMKGLWLKKFYVDDFGEETNKPYVQNHPFFKGKFSNSATTNSSCEFKFLIDDKDVDLMIYEYNNMQVKGEEKYSCQLKADNGYEIKFGGEMWSDRVTFDYVGKQAVLNCLKTNQNFKLYLKENSKYGTPSTYLFEVEADNFAYVYWK